MKKYIIIDRCSKSNSIQFITNDTKGLSKLWYLRVPRNKNLNTLDIKIFEDRAIATIYKDTAQSEINFDWKQNGHLEKLIGKEKAEFKIEEFNENK